MPAKPTVRIESLALAVGTGSTISEWCRENGVVERTARMWAAEPEFKARVREIRERLIDATVGKLAESAPAAVATLAAMIADPSATNTDRRMAANSLLSHLVDLVKFSSHEERLAALEAIMKEHGGHGV